MPKGQGQLARNRGASHVEAAVAPQIQRLCPAGVAVSAVYRYGGSGSSATAAAAAATLAAASRPAAASVRPSRQQPQHQCVRWAISSPHSRDIIIQPPRSSLRQTVSPHPDPAADDLDALAAAAQLAASPATAPNAGRVSGNVLLPPGEVRSIPDGVGTAALGMVAASTSTSMSAKREPLTHLYDKLSLTREEAADIAARLRRVGTPSDGLAPLRVYRIGIDDQRLYKALSGAGLEGRVVVVDSTDTADAVLVVPRKRSGRGVDIGMARRTAAAAGVPLLRLRAVSAQRLLEALAPLLVVRRGEDGDGTRPRLDQHEIQHEIQREIQLALSASRLDAGAAGMAPVGRPRTAPRLLRWEEQDGDGADELLGLLWGAPGSAGPEPPGAGPRWRAWAAAQARGASNVSSSDGAPAAVAAATARLADVGDDRVDSLPRNPTARAGQARALVLPARRLARVRRRALAAELAARDAPW